MTLSDIIKEGKNSITVPCWIQPKASKNRIIGIHGNYLKISLAAPPVDGKANAALCKFLAKKICVSKSSVSIIAGLQSRRKIVKICGVSVKEFSKKIDIDITSSVSCIQ